jgi:hypothetical protein
MVLAESRQFHKFIILTMMLLFPHDYAIDWNALGGSLLEDLRALVEFAQTGIQD